MKRFKILSAVVAVILMVGVVSCTTMGEANDGYYYGNDRVQGSNRIYVEDPYRGTVVLERDPYSGRYYEVVPYGYSPRYGSSRYGTVYNNNTRYRTRTTTRTNRNSDRYERQTTTPPRKTEDQKKEMDNKRTEARRKILGN